MSDYQAKGVRNNMNEPQMQPGTYSGANLGTNMGSRTVDHSASNGIQSGVFCTEMEVLNHLMKEAIERTENNVGQLIFHIRSGNKFSEQFAVGQKEFREQINQLQSDNPDRFAVKIDSARCAAVYLNKLSIFTAEVVQYLF